MKRSLILVFVLLGIMACKEKPYVEKLENVEKEETIKKHELKGAILFPVDQAVLNSDSFRDGVSVKASVSSAVPISDCRWEIHADPKSEEHMFKGQGLINGTNCQIEEALNGDNFINGKYYLKVYATDASGLELGDMVQNFQVLKKVPEVEIDQQAPTILGAIDGTPQRPYAQETINYRQEFIEANNRHVIEPHEKASAINWQKVPTIYRWVPRLDDLATAPGYSVRINDDNKLKEVRYKIAPKCASLDEADLIAKGEDGLYDIRFTADSMKYALTQDAERYCLSIWAVDQAGNASNHNVEFIWQVLMPPLSVDMNASRYKAHNREDDISWIGPQVRTLFRSNKNPLELKKNLVVGHAILFNPFIEPLAVSLRFSKAMDLKINQFKYKISADLIDVRYFYYDLIKGEIGDEITLNDGWAIIKTHEVILAKFILAKEMPLMPLEKIDTKFWKNFSLEIGFVKIGHERSIVDGLRLDTREPNLGILSGEFSVAWGAKHVVRKRTASRLAI